jgi:hypothetical protein
MPVPEPEDVKAIISGIFEINAALVDMAADLGAIRRAVEDDGEAEDQDG